MKTMSYTDARNNLAGLMKVAVNDREPVTITRNGEGAVVLLAQDEYNAMQETLHLYSTLPNAKKIRLGLEDYEAGNFQTGELCD